MIILESSQNCLLDQKISSLLILAIYVIYSYTSWLSFEPRIVSEIFQSKWTILFATCFTEALCNRTQNCGLTIPNIAVCYMLCQFAYPLRVVACSWELLLKVWNRSNVWANNPQHFFCPNIVGSCCIRLHTIANKDATTPNIVGLVRSLKDKTDVKDVFTLAPNVPCPNNYSK